MELAARAMDLATRALNSNVVINVALVGAFAMLSVRSLNQQRDIETLEMEKETLLKSNKAMKKAVWDWKQQLFAEASSSPDSALVPLSRLKSIYGEAPSAAVQADAAANAGSGEGKPAASRILV